MLKKLLTTTAAAVAIFSNSAALSSAEPQFLFRYKGGIVAVAAPEPDQSAMPATPADVYFSKPDLSHVDADNDGYLSSGDAIRLSFEIGNSSESPIASLGFKSTFISLHESACDIGLIIGGGSAACQMDWTVTQADLMSIGGPGTVLGLNSISALTSFEGSPVTISQSSDAIAIVLKELNPGMILFTPKTAVFVDHTGDGKIGAGDSLAWSMTVQNYTGWPLDKSSFNFTVGSLSGIGECGGVDDGGTLNCSGAHTFTAAEICAIPAIARDTMRDKSLMSGFWAQLQSLSVKGKAYAADRSQSLANNLSFTFTDAGAGCRKGQ